ncbi:MAG: hypothetical protein NFCOHLIN_02605 [Gammaproteobacteria bacterium]|nr:hypothetical protein [Gammaproteobacteria bacterium]
MARQPYQPPRQGVPGMIIDSLLMLVLVFFALMAPAWIAEWRAAHEPAAEAAATDGAAPAVTWEELGQNPTMQSAWEKLGKDPAAAKEIIDHRFDYTIDIVKLLFVAALIVFYFWFMLSSSAREYREVIAERFGDKDQG